MAWIALAAGIIGYNTCARDDEMMSEAADRYMLTHPNLTRLIAFMVAAHVTNAIPDRYDPIHWAFSATKARKKARARRAALL